MMCLHTFQEALEPPVHAEAKDGQHLVPPAGTWATGNTAPPPPPPPEMKLQTHARLSINTLARL